MVHFPRDYLAIRITGGGRGKNRRFAHWRLDLHLGEYMGVEMSSVGMRSRVWGKEVGNGLRLLENFWVK